MSRASSWFSWPIALGILVAAIATELLPVVFGAGEDATWDWGFIYVTMRFVLLPLVCALHLGWNLAAVFTRARTQTTRQWLSRSSVAVSIGYLIALYLDPLPAFRFLFH